MVTATDKLGAARAALREQADQADARFLRRYFKTGPGEYGEGDQFLGVRVPATRRVARSYRDLPLARSDLIWERRIAVMATFHFIKNGEFAETLKIAGMLLADPEDLIHRAAGWMLREVGKRDREAEESFLRENYRRMPRTMLRYAIEKFPEDLRRRYLQGKI